jgi:hypothetical protein
LDSANESSVPVFAGWRYNHHWIIERANAISAFFYLACFGITL